jgi:hypothetical protein
MEWTTTMDGEVVASTAEPVGSGLYWIVMWPAVTQAAVCTVAGASDVGVRSFPGFTVSMGPRQPVDTFDGRKLDKIRVDELVDVYCDGTKLAVVHYSKHALMIAREEYETYGVELAKNDPKNELWEGELKCPDKNE